MTKKGLIIIPCYNEEQTIVPLLRELESLSLTNIQLDILPVNDGSKDKTLQQIESQTGVYLNLINNLGIGGAVQSGIKYAYRNQYDFAVQMDGDGQHPPEELQKIISLSEQTGADLCIGSRYIDKAGFQSTFLRKKGIFFLNKLIRCTTGQKIHDCTSGYRLYNPKALALFSRYYPDKFPEPESIAYAALHKLNIAEVQVMMKERNGGVTSINGFSIFYYMVKVSLAILFLKLSFMINKK